MKQLWMAVAVVFAAVAGCTAPTGVDVGAKGGNGQGGSGAGVTTTTGTSTIGEDSGLPCDVAAVLSKLCTSCHSDPPMTGTPMPLLTYADLAAQKGGKSYAVLAVERMSSAYQPMPPGGGATATDIAAFQAWIDAGLPMGTCGQVEPGPVDTTFQGEPGCSSGMYFQPPEDIEDAKDKMYPGRACIKCHEAEDGPRFKVAGTVFDTGKVLDDCLPPAAVNIASAQVIITDANGVEHVLSVNKNGNFHDEEGDDDDDDDKPSKSIAFPYKAKVVYQGKERHMSSAQTNGDCNSCHTDAGTMSAPGRIALPK